MDKHLPIGIFDSGVGGLTVLRALQQKMPQESFVYLGDTARLPYGTKSQATVRQYALQASTFLAEQKIKCLVVACNTASSVALEDLQQQFSDIPVIGVIKPALKAAAEIAGTNAPLAVLATDSTIKWHAYQKESPNQTIFEWPCSLMVALAEAGWVSGPLVKNILETMLHPFFEAIETPVQTLVLGCTHFPVFRDTLAKILPLDTNIIDSAQWVAEDVANTLNASNMLQDPITRACTKYLVTDNSERFLQLAQIFLGSEINSSSVHTVHLTPSKPNYFLKNEIT